MSDTKAQLQGATFKAPCQQLRMPVVSARFRSVAERAVHEKRSHTGDGEA